MFLSLQKYKHLFFSKNRYWMRMENMSFMHSSRKCQEWKVYNMESYFTEIAQYFGLSFIILHSRYWKKWLFISHMFTSLKKIIVQVNNMACLWVDTIYLTANAHMVMQKYVRYLENKFAHNNSLVVSPFI